MTEIKPLDERKQTLDPWFLCLLRCPGCPEKRPVHLTAAEDALLCDCGKYSFPVRDGLPTLLVEEATLLQLPADPSDSPSNDRKDERGDE